MAFFGPLTYYRDPREEERAVGALAARGRPNPGPDAGAISSAISALAGSRQLPPEPEPTSQPLDPVPALSALRSAAPPEPVMELQPDPNVAEAGRSSSFGALAQAGRDRVPAPLAPPMKPAPVPVGMQREYAPDPPEPTDPDQAETAKVDGSANAQRQESAPDAPDEQAPRVNGWALAADILLNNGQGVQGIVGQAERQKKAFEESKRNKVTDEFTRSQRDIGLTNARLRGEELQQAIAKSKLDEDRRLHPEKYPLTPEQQIAKDRERREGDKATHDTDMGDWEKTEKNKLDYAAQEATATRSVEAQNERNRDNARADANLQLARDNAGESRRAHDETRQDRLDRQATTDSTAREKVADTFSANYSKANKRNLDAAMSIKTIDGLLSKYKGQDIPGLGPTDSYTSAAPAPIRALAGLMNSDTENADSEAMHGAAANLVSSVLREESGAAAAVPEHVATQIRAGFEKGATEEQAQTAFKLARDIIHGRLRGSSVANPDRARMVMQEQGIDPDAVFGRSAEPPKQNPEAPTEVEFVPKPVTSTSRSSLADESHHELGSPVVADEDWRKRFEKWKVSR